MYRVIKMCMMLFFLAGSFYAYANTPSETELDKLLSSINTLKANFIQ